MNITRMYIWAFESLNFEHYIDVMMSYALIGPSLDHTSSNSCHNSRICRNAPKNIPTTNLENNDSCWRMECRCVLECIKSMFFKKLTSNLFIVSTFFWVK